MRVIVVMVVGLRAVVVVMIVGVLVVWLIVVEGRESDVTWAVI